MFGSGAGRSRAPGNTGAPSDRFLITAVALVALNMRPAVTSAGAELATVRAALHLSEVAASCLASLPVICFCSGAAVAGWLSGRLNLPRLVLSGLALTAIGLALRALAWNGIGFLVGSAVALEGIAIANVIVPIFIKRCRRFGLVLGSYAVCLIVGAALAGAVTVPLAEMSGLGWRFGLGVWAALAAVSAVPWWKLRHVHGTAHLPNEYRRGALRPYRSRTAWLLALHFGMQALGTYTMMAWLPTIYSDSGISHRLAGVLASVASLLSIPATLWLSPFAAGRPGRLAATVISVGALSSFGYLGIGFAPSTAPWGWSILLASVYCSFPLSLLLLGSHAATEPDLARLSSFVQTVGYAAAALGPFGLGALHAAADGWGVPMLALIGTVLAQTFAGLLAIVRRLPLSSQRH